MEAIVKAKVNETFTALCRDLSIPYDPHESNVDPRAVVIYNALSWIAEYVAKQYANVWQNPPVVPK